MTADPEALRIALRNWATGVTIVSATDGAASHGMTVSTFTSISLTPPLILVSLEKVARTHDLVQRSGAFGVSILSQEQQEISDRFAGRHTEDLDRFAGLAVRTLVTGAPLLAENLSCFDCSVTSSQAIGTHTVFFGEVLALEVNANAKPLIYFQQAYRMLQG